MQRAERGHWARPKERKDEVPVKVHGSQRFRLIIAAAGGAGLCAAALLSPDLPPYPEWREGAATDSSDRIVVAFRNDDISVYSRPSLEDSVVTLFRRYGVPQTVAVIPLPAGYLGKSVPPPSEWPQMSRLLRAWREEGLIEYALHGLTHERNPRKGTGGEFDGRPHGEQGAMLRLGKSIVDSLLGDRAEIFAPPWNQADRVTLEELSHTGLRIYSGYIGGPDVPGVLQVNTNAVLFSGSTGLPDAGEMYERVAQGTGTRFLVIFYHSRVDFPDRSAFEHADSLLARLASDRRVVFATLGQVAVQYASALRPYASAGKGIMAAEEMLGRAKPYRLFLRSEENGRADGSGPDAALRRAESAWSHADYHRAYDDAGASYASSRRWVAGGRAVLVAFLLGLVWLAWAALRSRRVLQPGGRLAVFVGALVVPSMIAVLAFQWMDIVSPVRTAEGTVLAILFASGVLLSAPVWSAAVRGASPTVHHSGSAQ